MSGRLDNETLNALRAFPGQRNGPPRSFPGHGLPESGSIAVSRPRFE